MCMWQNGNLKIIFPQVITLETKKFTSGTYNIVKIFEYLDAYVPHTSRKARAYKNIFRFNRSQ